MPRADETDVLTEVAEALADQLRRTGQVITGYTTPEQCAFLRRAGRKAGRLLHRPITTRDTDHTVIIAVSDWGDANPLETELTNIRIRKATDRAFRAMPTHPDTSPER